MSGYTGTVLAVVLAAGLGAGPGVVANPVPVRQAQSTAAPQPPSDLRVPELAVDESSLSLVWHKPLHAENIVDYHVYQNGRLVGSASATTGSASLPFVTTFYADPANASQVKIVMNNFTVTGLAPDTRYRFTVRSVDRRGVESRDSAVTVQKTTQVAAVFDIEDFGAVGDGSTLNTAAIQRAIDAATRGATVLVPRGVYTTGSLWLKSNMTLEVADGATLLGSADAADYPYHYRLYDYSTDERFYALINAQDFTGRPLENIRIVGAGTIDGNGWKQNGTSPEGLPVLVAGSAATVASAGILAAAQVALAAELGSPAPYPTRSNLITLRGVDNVYYEGFTALNPSNHTLVNLESNDVTVNGVKILTFDANNADGVEFAHGDGLTVYNTLFDTGDDCVNFAAGLGQRSADDPPTRNAWIFNNYFREGHGAVVAGSHTGAVIENVTAEDNVMVKTDVGLRMKTNPANGGGAQSFLFRDSAMKDISNEAFIFTSTYSDPNAAVAVEPAQAPGYFRGIRVEHVTVDGMTKESIKVEGIDGQAHRDIHFRDVRFRHGTKTTISQLQDSTFEDVIFDDVVDPWLITDSRTLVFSGGTTQSATSTDAGQAPRWPASAQLSAAPSGQGVQLSWPAATDNTAVAQYRLYLNDRLVQELPAGSTSADLTGLAPRLRYRAEVRAYDATGDAGVPLAVRFRTAGDPDTVAPTAPQGPGAISVRPVGGAVGSTWASITWQGASDDVGVYSYVISVDGTAVRTVPGDQLAATVGGLTPDAALVLGITAVDETGNATPYPVPLTVTTAPYPPTPGDPRAR